MWWRVLNHPKHRNLHHTTQCVAHHLSAARGSPREPSLFLAIGHRMCYDLRTMADLLKTEGRELAEAPEAPKEVLPTPEPSKELPSEQPAEQAPVTEAPPREPVPIATPVVPPAPAPAPPPKDPMTQEIEAVLSDDLEAFYKNLPPDQKKKFKEAGERTAKSIREMMQKGKLHVRKVVDLIRNWLKLIPGVNKFFLEQEVKIKTDKILAIEEENKKNVST